MAERGQTIQAGQVVALLDGTPARTALQSNSDKLAVVNGRLSRLRLESEILNFDKPLLGQGDLNPLNYDILTKRINEYRGKARSFTSNIT